MCLFDLQNIQNWNIYRIHKIIISNVFILPIIYTTSERSYIFTLTVNVFGGLENVIYYNTFIYFLKW